MKAGVNILNFGPGASPEALLGWAQVAEALGYHSVFISDHIAITPSIRDRYPEPLYDPFAALAFLAGRTTRVQLGTTVIVLPYRNPLLTARLGANVDQLSNGRFIFGCAVGGWEDEFAALGVSYKQRGHLATESLEAILALWTADAPVSYQGRLVRFEDVSPMATNQKPRPPVWVGGWTEAALRRAVLLGDAWHPILRPAPRTDPGIDDLRRVAEQAKRPVPLYCPRIRLDIRKQPVDGERQLGVGSIDQVRDDLGELQRLGAEHVTLDWYTGDVEATRNHARGWEMLARLAQDVFDLRAGTLR